MKVEAISMLKNYSIEISQDEIDAAIALSREKFLRDTWSEKKLAEEKARTEGREEQRLNDEIIINSQENEISRLKAEIEALKKARI